MKCIAILFIALFNAWATWVSARGWVKLGSDINDYLDAMLFVPVLIAWVIIVSACWLFLMVIIHHEKD
jgi:hypothetical protein